MAACAAAGIRGIKRLERSRRYRLSHPRAADLLRRVEVLQLFGDRMTECLYTETPVFVDSAVSREAHFTVDILGANGSAEFERLNTEVISPLILPFIDSPIAAWSRFRRRRLRLLS